MLGPRILRVLDGTVEAVATAAFIVMFAAALGQVLFRYVLHIPAPWTEELARTLFTCSMLLGIAIAVRRDEHIKVAVLSGRLSPRAQASLLLLFNILILVFLVSLARGTVGMVRLTWGSYLIALDWLREGWLYVVQLTAIALMILYAGLRAAEHVRTLAGRGAGAGGRQGGHP